MDKVVGIDPTIVSYKKHGHWVRHKEFGIVGRICYYLPYEKKVVVFWEPDKNWNHNIASASVCSIDSLSLLRGYKPQPWYDFEDIERRALKDPQEN